MRWLVKVRRYGGGESVIARYEYREAAEQHADDLNRAYQSDNYYVEEFDQAKQHWFTGEEATDD